MSRAAAGTELFVVTSAFENGWSSASPDDPLASFKEGISSSRAKRLALESIENGSGAPSTWRVGDPPPRGRLEDGGPRSDGPW